VPELTNILNSDVFAPPPPPPDVQPDLKVAFILSPRFTILPFSGFVDCLRHAADEADNSRQIFCRWTVIAPALTPIASSCGLEVLPQEILPDPGGFDYIVVVGGLLPWCLEHPQETYDYLRLASRRTTIVGLCTGSFILAQAGLLKGRRCGVHVEHMSTFAYLFPDARPVSDEIYVTEPGLITCPGGTAAIDLAVELIMAHCGKMRALKGLNSMLVDKHRAAHHIPARSYAHLTDCGDWRVEGAITLMERNLSHPFGISELARRLGTSPRNLTRAFKQVVDERPNALWRKLRLSHGHWLLANTGRSITQIAFECGFSDSAHFCRCFKKLYGESPGAFRASRKVGERKPVLWA
jgi:transcriptional regulator GlxA family with amidase domain